jgi:hypothetical protein
MKTFLISFLFPLQLFAQDLTGIWTGFLFVGENKLPYELVISGDKKKLSGYSLIVFTFGGVENVGLKEMDIKIKRGSISIEDGELIYDNYNTPPRRVKLYGSLAWVGKDTNMALAGTFSTRSLDMRALNENSFKGLIRLKKNRPGTQTKLVSKLNEMNLDPHSPMQAATTKNEIPKEVQKITKQSPTEAKPGQINGSTKQTEVITTNETGKKLEPAAVTTPAADFVKRETDIIQTVAFKSDSIVISLYDNGEIDGDTVSVLLNGNVIIAKQGLTAKAITTTVYTGGLSDSLQLVMYAENLGRIPPNSGLLVVQDGIDRYRIRFSGDLQKNSAIILKRKR